MKRIYSNYTIKDFCIVESLAKEQGFSLAAFQHYCVMLYANKRGNTFSLNTLMKKMLQALDEKPKGSTFIVSALLSEEWSSLSRSDKMTLAKQLAHFVKMHPSEYEKARISKGSPTLYRKK